MGKYILKQICRILTRNSFLSHQIVESYITPWWAELVWPPVLELGMVEAQLGDPKGRLFASGFEAGNQQMLLCSHSETVKYAVLW